MPAAGPFGVVVWVDGGWVEVLEPGGGAAAPPAAEPEDPEVPLEELAPLELVGAPGLLFAAAVAALSIPPWPLHAPRPP